MESSATAQSCTPALPGELKVSREEITVGEQLWSGDRGNVYKGKWREVMDIAVKILRADTTSPEEYLNEAKILSQLHHQKILRFLALSTEKEPPYIITELIDKGPLLQFLRKNKEEVTDAVVAHMAAQIADGMAYLGSMNIVHRDLRAVNILVGTHHSVKVAGFELAHTMTNNTYKADKDAKFPLKWTSPEAGQEYTFSVKSDVWSYGVLLYEMSTFGKTPYAGMDPKQALEQVAKGYRMPQPPGHTCCDEGLYDIMCKCWDADPQKRPSFAFLHNHFENRYISTDLNLKHDCHEEDQLSEIVFVEAVFDHKAGEEDEMSFDVGDVMKVEEALYLHWWTCSHLMTTKRKMVPSNHVSSISLLQATRRAMESWWVDFDWKEAEKVLFSKATQTGTFIVQESTDGRGYVLSVRVTDEKNGGPKIVHYDVNLRWNGGVHIYDFKWFSNILQLIEHYSVDAHGLCTRLTVPCPRYLPVVQFRELEVKRNAVELSQLKLGHGRYGDVWKGSLWGTLDVAVKVLKSDSRTSAFEEAKILHRLRHDRILQLLAVCTEQESVYIVTELMVYGTLLRYLRGKEGALVTFPNVVAMASQVADGMAYLESEKILHLDLRAGNILVGERRQLKVAHFSEAVHLQEEQHYTLPAGVLSPLKWVAPEMTEDRRVSFESVVWAFGGVLYELITRGMTLEEVAKHVCSGKHMEKPAVGMECPDGFHAIMCKCWEIHPGERPSFSQLRDSLESYFVSTEHLPESSVQSDSSPQKDTNRLRDQTLDGSSRTRLSGEGNHIQGAEMQRRPEQPVPVPRHSLRFYRMEAIPRGICLIVSNRDFYKDPQNTTAVMLTRRQGSDVDRDKLQSTFENLHFKVEIHDNKTDTELLRLLVDTAGQDHGMYDCFVCCILSHGSLGVVYGANGVAVAIRDLTSQFRAQLCPSLRGKPKLFFLQACQGLAEQTGYDCLDTESDAVEEEEVQKIPDEADFLLGCSTIPGIVSYRSTDTGSCYIRKLTETLDEYGEGHDIHEILSMVNYSVGKDDISTGIRKQTPAAMYTLRKKLVFKPSQ